MNTAEPLRGLLAPGKLALDDLDGDFFANDRVNAGVDIAHRPAAQVAQHFVVAGEAARSQGFGVSLAVAGLLRRYVQLGRTPSYGLFITHRLSLQTDHYHHTIY